MVQGYYTLAEAAQFLSMSPDELKQMSQRKELRSFQDRGTLRFRIQDIQELGRMRGGSSDPELKLGDAGVPPPRTPARPSKSSDGPKTPSRSSVPEVFNFALDGPEENVGIGREPLKEGPRSSSKGRTPKSPPAPPGSDSDVRLVAEGIHFKSPPGSDSDVKLVGDSGVRRPETPSSAARKSAQRRGSGAASPLPKRPAGQVDSGVRLVPMESDSDVKIVGAGSIDVNLGEAPPPSATDSDIRLERFNLPSGNSAENLMLTDEINLDDELKKQQPKRLTKIRPKGSKGSAAPQSGISKDSSGFDVSTGAAKDSSSDFDISPQAPAEAAVYKDDDTTGDFSLELIDDDSHALGGEEGALTGPSSGINLGNPVDAGISLEDPDAVDFDVSLEAGATPIPQPVEEQSGSSEFELSLDSDPGLEASTSEGDGSDSEFELTLDEGSSADLMTLDESPSVEKDIFESDFEVSALQDDSDSEEATLDADMGSSDFDIALEDSDLTLDDDSGSQVIAIDDESADDASATVTAESSVIVMDDEEESDAVAAVVDEDEPVVYRDAAVISAEPAKWGVVPVLFMLPCVLVTVMVGLLGFELIQSTNGYRGSPGMLTKTVADLIQVKLK